MASSRTISGQRDRDVRARTGRRPAGRALPWLAGIVLFLAAPDPGAGSRRLPCRRARHARLRPDHRRRRRSRPTASSTMSATSSRWSQRSARNASCRSSATTGARRSPGTPRCSGRTFSPRSQASACRRPSAAAAGRWRRCARAASPISTGSIFSRPASPKPSSKRDVALTMRTVLAGRGFSDPSAHQFVEEGKGFLAGGNHDRPLPDWLTEADLAYFTEGLHAVRLPRRAELVPQPRSQLGADRGLAGCANPSAVAVPRRLEGRRHHRPDRRQARRRHGARAARI